VAGTEVTRTAPEPRGAGNAFGAATGIALLTFVGAALVAAEALPADAPELSWIDRTALEAGEVIEQTDKQGGTISIDTAVLVRASPEAIWEVLTACELGPEYVPNVVSCRSIEKVDGGRAEFFEQTVKPAFFLPRFEHVFRLDYDPYRRIDVHEVSGPIEYLEGSWWLLPEPPDRILLVYSLEVNPGFPIPRFVLRASLKRDVPRILRAVRDRAEAADASQ
jgi:ribosome-associated toxin RatA of RatAB toxin-antitoxin module